MTLHPSYVTPELGEAIRDCDKAERFLPIPAQSGSDRILRGMKRGYNVELYRKRTEMLRAAVPDIELGSDWIVGFPGESDAEHDESERFLVEQGFAVNYIFKYSPRPGTAAEALADDVPEEEKKRRNQRLLELGAQTGLSRNSAHVGQVRRTFVGFPSFTASTLSTWTSLWRISDAPPPPGPFIGSPSRTISIVVVSILSVDSISILRARSVLYSVESAAPPGTRSAGARSSVAVSIFMA